MYTELLAGAELKIENAQFFLDGMARSLRGPQRTQINAAIQAAGAIVDDRWQRSFYAHLDAFLAMVRSVPDIIQCCLGVDDRWPVAMKAWFNGLPVAEQARRQTFAVSFGPLQHVFATLPLSNARNISLHRSGVAPVEVNIRGRFGVVHVGTPVEHVPIAESAPIGSGNDAANLWAGTLPPVPVRPAITDFTIDGRPLFPECQAYLQKARDLLAQAHKIAQSIHGNQNLTPLP
jgi:hypothetical protein